MQEHSLLRRLTTKPALLSLVILVGAAFFNVSSAATLDLSMVNSPVRNVDNAHRCVDGPLVLTPAGTPAGDGSYSAVQVSDVGDCEQVIASLYLSAAPHTVAFSGAGTVSGGAVTFAVDPFFPPDTSESVTVLSLDGWLVPSSWEYEAPIPETAFSCSIVGTSPYTCWLVPKQYSWSGEQIHFQFDVHTDSPALVKWEVTLDISQQGTAHGLSNASHPTLFPGYPVPAGDWWTTWTPTRFAHYNLCSVGTNAALPNITLRGAHDWNNRASASQPATSAGLLYSRHSGNSLGSTSQYGASPPC